MSLIGIVSKDEHIKNHLSALRKEGYQVMGLGGSPVEIPPTVDLLILRTQSCSHGGSDTAYSWNRATKKPLIVENGLSGIRSKLRKYSHLLNRTFDEKTVPMQEVSVTSNIATASENPSAPFVGTLPKDFSPKFPSGPYSWDPGALPPLRLRRAFVESLSFYRRMPPEAVMTIRETFQKARGNGRKTPYFPSLSTWTSWNFLGMGSGLACKPLQFFLFLQWCIQGSPYPPPDPGELQRAYTDFCGSSSSSLYVRAAIWTFKKQILPEPQVLSEVEEAPETPKPQVLSEVEEAPETPKPQVSESPEISQVSSSPALTGENPSGFTQLKSELEDFVLDLASTNQELLNLVKGLREEVKTLREEVATLKASPFSKLAPNDPLQAILTLREIGALVTISFGEEK